MDAKRHRMRPGLMFAFAALALTGCRMRDEATDRATLLQLEQTWLDAARHHDRATLARVLAEDFVDTDTHGAVRDKATVLAGNEAPADATQTLRDLRVRFRPDLAVVTGTNVVHSPAQGWTVEVAFTDVFVRRHGQWQALSGQETARHSVATGH